MLVFEAAKCKTLAAADRPRGPVRGLSPPPGVPGAGICGDRQPGARIRGGPGGGAGVPGFTGAGTLGPPAADRPASLAPSPGLAGFYPSWPTSVTASTASPASSEAARSTRAEMPQSWSPAGSSKI